MILFTCDGLDFFRFVLRIVLGGSGRKKGFDDDDLSLLWS